MKHENKKVFASVGTRNAIISLRLIGWTIHEKKIGEKVNKNKEGGEREKRK